MTRVRTLKSSRILGMVVAFMVTPTIYFRCSSVAEVVGVAIITVSATVEVIAQQLIAPEAVEAIPELEFGQTANLTAEARHDSSESSPL